ncbi:MAG: PD-(D/E)XK nuclease family protein [Halioglobus sp.]
MPNAIQIRKIKVTLALKADGALAERQPDALGEITLGPHGFLNLLETQLGIPSVVTSFSTRLIQYLGCIDQIDHPGAFYHASYEADPFSVARTLLQWRDQWYEAGWNGHFESGVPAKLADMATIEELAESAVEPSTGQRIERIIELLADNPIAIESITLRDLLADFPHLWHKLIEATGAQIIEAAAIPPQADATTDLGKLQRHLLSDTHEKISLKGDGSVVVLRGDSPQESTPLTALLTQHWLEQAPSQSIALLAERRGELLDDTLESIHSPRLGFNSLSPWRPVFQVLPLACELLWEPLNPTALFQFLSHSVGPIPRRIREKLAQTVANTPGIGSEDWENTIAQCLEDEDEAKRSKLKDNLLYWLESPRFSPAAGVDSQTLSHRAQRVADWLQGAKEASDDAALKSLYNIALNQALEFVNAIERLRVHGREQLTQDNVRRLIEDVRGTGASVTDRSAEVIPGQARVLRADHAGAFATPIDNVIWWDCQASDRVHRWPWSRTERAALADNGVRLHAEDAQLDWLGRAWLRPILCAKGRFTLVLHDDAERHHPVWDQIDSLTKGLPALQISASNTAADLGVSSNSLDARALPAKVRWWHLSESLVLPKRDAESFSSLDSYIHSPYQWLLRYAARVRPGSLASVNDGNLLKGSLAHRCYEEFLNAHPDIASIDPRDIAGWVDDTIATLLQQEGALLLEAGRQAECERFITQVQESLTTLVEHLQAAAVVKVDMELWQEGLFAGGKLNGSIDVLATRADGREAVVDIKWGGKSYRRDALLKNSYLQLATYAQLRRNNGADWSAALSYFIVQDSHLLSLNHDFFPNAEIIKPEGEENTAQYWHRFEQSWHWRKEQFDQGLVEVTVAETEPTADSAPQEDALEKPEASDTFNDYKVLTGWGTNA